MTKRLRAEFLGTFALVLAGTWAITAELPQWAIALVFGTAVLSMIFAFGRISGAHINPAVTLALFAARRIEGRIVVPYVAVQFAGGVAASLIVATLFPQHPRIGATIPAGAAWQSFGLEAIMTFLLMYVVLVSPKNRVAWAAGAVVGLEAFFGGPISGASMNPARSLAPAVVSGVLDSLWIYLSAPTLGALVAVLACRCVREPGCCCREPA